MIGYVKPFWLLISPTCILFYIHIFFKEKSYVLTTIAGQRFEWLYGGGCSSLHMCDISVNNPKHITHSNKTREFFFIVIIVIYYNLWYCSRSDSSLGTHPCE